MELTLARAGRTVLYIADNPEEARSVIDLICDEAQVESFCRIQGREEIRFTNGGRLLFRLAYSSGHRGISADAVSVSHSQVHDIGWMLNVYQCLVPRDGRLLIRM